MNGAIIPIVDGHWKSVSTLNVDTTKITGNLGITAMVRNGLCYVDLKGMIFASAGDSQSDCITGLPKALKQGNALLCSGNSTQTYDQTGNSCWINEGGTAVNFHIRNRTNRCWGTLIYPCEDI